MKLEPEDVDQKLREREDVEGATRGMPELIPGEYETCFM